MKSATTAIIILLAFGCSVKNLNNESPNSAQIYSETYFVDSAAFDRLQEFFPIVDQVFKSQMEKNHYPGVAYGIIANGQLVHAGSYGLSNLS